LTSAIDPDSSYTYSYDQADRVTQSSNAGTAGVPSVAFDYGYDAANYLVSTKDTIAGQVRGTTNLTRDRLNRVTQIQQSGVGVANKRVDMNYDAASQLKGIKRYTDLSGTQLIAATKYNYDLAGRLENMTHRKADNIRRVGITSFSPMGFTTTPMTMRGIELVGQRSRQASSRNMAGIIGIG
jgi:hypothetical protein